MNSENQLIPDDHFSTIFLSTLYGLTHAANRFYKTILDPLDLSSIEWYTLFRLFHQDGQRATDLAQAVARPVTSFTPIVDGLEEKGFVSRKPDRRDRRAILIYLTEQGQQFREQFEASTKQLETELRSSVSEADLQRLIKLWQRLEGKEEKP